MTCQQCVEVLSEYVAGTMRMQNRAETERHLSRCARCPGYLRQYAGTLRLAKAAFGERK